MRVIASDTSLILPGLLSTGQRRRLLVVFAYGAACHYTRFGDDETAALEQLAADNDTRVGGLPISDLITRAAAQKAQFEELLPALIEIGLRAAAVAMVSDDRRHVALSAEAPTVYRDSTTGAQLGAYQFAPFVEEHVNTVHFELSDIDPGLLRVAYR